MGREFLTERQSYIHFTMALYHNLGTYALEYTTVNIFFGLLFPYISIA